MQTAKRTLHRLDDISNIVCTDGAESSSTGIFGGEEEDESAQFAGYFTVENSIEGMKTLVRDMFGITMEEAAIPIEERWDIDTTKTGIFDEATKAGGGGMRKFEFHHEEDGPLGTMYFNLHPRNGKFVHAAHFTIRCGRIRNEDPLPILFLAIPSIALPLRGRNALPRIRARITLVVQAKTTITT